MTALAALEGLAGVLARPRPLVHVPAQGTLDADLRQQRLAVVRVYSLGMGVCALIWCVAFLAYALLTGEREALTVVITAQTALLGAAGWYAVYRCSQGQLRRATYTNFAALLLAATTNLACTTNAEGVAVITYGIALSMVAMVIEGREWLWVWLIVSAAALVGSLLHTFPVVAQAELPRTVAVTALLCTASLGLAIPAGLFWLFSSNLTASRAEAWTLARDAAAAHALASERAAQLELRTEQLQAKNAELNDFLYVVSHDLRAPLINLEGFSRTLRDDLAALGESLTAEAADAAPATAWTTLRDEIDESLDFIMRSTAKMDFLVQGLLDLSRIDSRPHVAQPIDLAHLVDEVLASLQFTIAERGIAVQVDPLPVVSGDPVRVSQVFSNLIDNAIKYAAPSGAAHIHVGVATHDGAAHFFVRDDGIGIRSEDQVKIFRLFSRVGNHGVPGDGMGLTAVKKILEKHGGKIWVDSALGRGSTFWFTLPPAAPADGTEVDGARPRDQDSPGRG